MGAILHQTVILSLCVFVINGYSSFLLRAATDIPSNINSTLHSHLSEKISSKRFVNTIQNSTNRNINMSASPHEVVTTTELESEWVPFEKTTNLEGKDRATKIIEHDNKNISKYFSQNMSSNNTLSVSNYLNENNQSIEAYVSLTPKTENTSELIETLMKGSNYSSLNITVKSILINEILVSPTASNTDPLDVIEERKAQLVSHSDLLKVLKGNDHYDKKNIDHENDTVTSSSQSTKVTEIIEINHASDAPKNVSVYVDKIRETKLSTDSFVLTESHDLPITNSFKMLENHTFTQLKDAQWDLPNSKISTNASMSPLERTEFGGKRPNNNLLSFSREISDLASTISEIPRRNTSTPSEEDLELSANSTEIQEIDQKLFSTGSPNVILSKSLLVTSNEVPEKIEHRADSTEITTPIAAKVLENFRHTTVPFIETKFKTREENVKVKASNEGNVKVKAHTEKSKLFGNDMIFAGTETFQKSESSESETPKHIPMIYNPGVTMLKLAVSITFLAISLTAVVVVIVYILKMRRNTIPYEELSLVP